VTVCVDTSGLYALLDQEDPAHDRATSVWREFHSTGDDLVTSNYLLLEMSALIGHRLGIEALRAFHADFVLILSVDWVDEGLHDRSMSVLLTANQRRLSFVDCVGFEIMRVRGLTTAFAIDAHFSHQGFRCLPDPV
jgi:predicted nucleic acid-binding protein